MQSFFHCAPIPLRAGSIIEPGNWGRIVRLYQPNFGNYAVAFREKVLEEIRLKEFPHKPSRLECCYMVPSYEIAKTYQNRADSRTLLIYEVELLYTDTPNHIGDWTYCYPVDDSYYFDEMEECARQYWRGEGVGNTEILVNSPIRILRCVDASSPRCPDPAYPPKPDARKK
ncbi:DUF2441 domain-containing protein [Magnetospirillum molischianum]|uniref:Uncharacterized protein n=1 Tax=Magnetospirillum molischianum DSM 120 TaxID=1150626 RepID=H8FV11_MAGML|nr:conserved hypothetical protein [Magnetospirillum molischianum DSM 120]